MVNLNYDTMYEQFDYIVKLKWNKGNIFRNENHDIIKFYNEDIYIFNENQHEINILNDLATTEDEDLLLMVVDRLRLSFDYNKIPNIDIIKQRVSEIKEKADIVNQMIINDFLNKEN